MHPSVRKHCISLSREGTNQANNQPEKKNVSRKLVKTARKISNKAARTVRVVSMWQKRHDSFRFLDLPPGKLHQPLAL